MKTCFIIGGGASLKPEVDNGVFKFLENRGEVWSINFAYKLIGYEPTKQIWLDKSFWENNKKDILAMKSAELCTKVNGNDYYPERVNVFRTSRDPVHSNEELFVGHNGLSGLFAVSLAWKRGYERVYLLGYDYGSVSSNATHWYQNMAISMGIKSHGIGNTKVYLDDNGNIKWSDDWKYYESFKNHVINVGLDSNIKVFPKISYPDFYKEIGK